MLKVVAIMLSGMAVGFFLRKRQMDRIYDSLEQLGIEVGSNPQVINGITNLGLEALWLSVTGMAGTLLFAWALWKWTNVKKKGGKR